MAVKYHQQLSSSLVGMTELQEDMAGPSQSDLECMKILLPRLYAEILVSAHFLCAKSSWGSQLGMNLSLYLAMLIIVHAKTIDYNGPMIRT